MDPRRRASGGSLGHGIGVGAGRPSSAPRRRPPPASTSGFGLDFSQFAKEPSTGLSRQASAPSFVHSGPGGPGNLSFDSLSRGVPQGQGASAGLGLRRSASTTSIRAPGRSAGGAPLPRGSSFSSAPRRRPYESSAPAYNTPDRDMGAQAHMGYQHKADAIQLESRLTERLREHSLASAEPTRRPDPRRKAGSGGSKYGGWAEGLQRPDAHFQHGMQDASFAHPTHAYHDRPMAGHYPSAHASPLVRAPGSRGGSPWHSRAPAAHPEATPGNRQPPHSATPSPYQQSHLSSHYGGSMRGRPMEEDSTMPESRLKIYSDLFEEVIDRDRVFGSLLRKVKTAYDSILSGQAEAAVPMMPGGAYDVSGMNTSHMSAGRQYRGGAAPSSCEPTLRAEDGRQPWEVHRENQVLKDLVERLHLELEEAVKREQRWKHKATKLKARNGVPGPQPPPMPPPLQGVGGYGPGSGYPPDNWPPAMPVDEQVSCHGKGLRSFHSSLREPDLHSQGQEGTLNQGGLLSLSSISPQNSSHHKGAMDADWQPPPVEIMDGGLGSCVDTARSTDSGMLPQRPERRHVIKPAHVPSLDFSRLKQQVDEEEEEEEDEEDDEDIEAIEGLEGQYPDGGRMQHMQGSDSGYSPRDEPHGEKTLAGYQYEEAAPESD